MIASREIGTSNAACPECGANAECGANDDCPFAELFEGGGKEIRKGKGRPLISLPFSSREPSLPHSLSHFRKLSITSVISIQNMDAWI